MSSGIAIKAEGLGKRFEHTGFTHPDEKFFWALRDVSFEVACGENIGVIGPNGSGKSTLLKILAGVTRPSEGRVEVNGRVASILEIGSGFHPELSGRKNIFLNGNLLGFSRADISSQLENIIEFSGIRGFIDDPVKNYSNGMYLKLAFSILIHLDFDIYLFDEVFSVGDFQFSIQARERIRDLLSSKKTVILVTHNMNEVGTNDRWLLLENGFVSAYSSNIDIVTSYLDRGRGNAGLSIATRNTSVKKIISNKIPSLEVLNLKLMQTHSGEFRNDMEFIIEIELVKKGPDGVHHLILLFEDSIGNPIMYSVPSLSNISPISNNGTYVYRCVIPPNLFGFQTYAITLVFVKDVWSENLWPSITKVDVEQIRDSTLKAERVIMFKAKVCSEMVNFNLLSSLHIHGGLLPKFEWVSQFSSDD